jgi:aminobenzoyl-glutamate utilization protein B
MKKAVSDYIENNKELFICSAHKIHEAAEIAGEEKTSSAILEELFENEGFKVEKGLGSQMTAFRATWGSGSLSLGFLAEYDALPNLSLDPSVKSNGHGCGHNLLGVGSVLASIALKNNLKESDVKLVVYGTPAEETLYGKTALCREGYFTDVDIVLAWHPLTQNLCGERSHKAMTSVKYSFKGITAHASVCPEKGRSAVDACELMNVGVNYLREHVPPHVRMHNSYFFNDFKPNIVPDNASSWYFLRARDRATCDDVFNRVTKIAEGAALMTETSVSYEVLSSTKQTIINSTLSNLAYDNMMKIGYPSFSKDEIDELKNLIEEYGFKDIKPELDSFIEKPDGIVKEEQGSTDLSAVSHVVPTLEFNVACFAKGTPNHHIAITAQSDRTIANKGMLFASKVLAFIALDLIDNPQLVEKAKVEFDSRKAML